MVVQAQYLGYDGALCEESVWAYGRDRATARRARGARGARGEFWRCMVPAFLIPMAPHS